MLISDRIIRVKCSRHLDWSFVVDGSSLLQGRIDGGYDPSLLQYIYMNSAAEFLGVSGASRVEMEIQNATTADDIRWANTWYDWANAASMSYDIRVIGNKDRGVESFEGGLIPDLSRSHRMLSLNVSDLVYWSLFTDGNLIAGGSFGVSPGVSDVQLNDAGLPAHVMIEWIESFCDQLRPGMISLQFSLPDDPYQAKNALAFHTYVEGMCHRRRLPARPVDPYVIAREFHTTH